MSLNVNFIIYLYSVCPTCQLLVSVLLMTVGHLILSVFFVSVSNFCKSFLKTFILSWPHCEITHSMLAVSATSELFMLSCCVTLAEVVGFKAALRNFTKIKIKIKAVDLL